MRKKPDISRKITGQEEGFIPALLDPARESNTVMAKKWGNRNLAGALHFITANCLGRVEVFSKESNCLLFFDSLRELKEKLGFKLIAYVVMPDHCHLIVNPRDGKITDLSGALKGVIARKIIDASSTDEFAIAQASDGATYQLWQDSFKALPLWSLWMIWQKINYIHNNPLKAGLATSATDYRWSSFRAFYNNAVDPIVVDKEWWWPEDVRKLEDSMAEWRKESQAGSVFKGRPRDAR